MATKLESSNARHYLDRGPERLVIQGYRHWMGGYSTGCVECWELPSDIYSEELGTGSAAPVLFALGRWVRLLRQACPRDMNFFPHGSRHLCRDECLVMALIAAAQHSEEAAISRVVAEIVAETAPSPCLDAARHFAAALNACGQRMLPVPLHVVEDIAGRPAREMFY